MTLSEDKLSSRLYDISFSRKEENYVEILMGIDFSSWNIHWTYSSTELIFQMMDEMLGTKGLILYTHEFFQSAKIILSSRLNPPFNYIKKPAGTNITEQIELEWDDHQGGLEGQRQK